MTRPLIMGVVNVTPDSFSDGGRFFDPAAAIAHGHALIARGAELLDVGGESTRPGAAPVEARDEIDRIVPVIQALAGRGAVICVDTMKPAVARAAMAAGAAVWNDVTALTWAPESLATAAQLGCGVVLMHMQGEPRTMQARPWYDDVVPQVLDHLATRAEAAMQAGVARKAIWLDPGIGFGKTLEHNLALMAALDQLVALGFRTLIGVSRKRFIRALDPIGAEADDRLGGSLAGALIGAAAGVDAVRVHDVRETAQAFRVWAAVSAARPIAAS